MCWALNIVPSQLRDLYYTVSYTDLKTAISLKTEEKLVDTMQMFESLAIIVSRALSGGPSAGADPSKAPKTADELEAALARALG